MDSRPVRPIRGLRAIVFDYGSTLIEFGHASIGVCDRALADALAKMFQPPDFDKLHAHRNRNRLAPYTGDPPEYRENELPEITAELVRDLYGVDPTDKQLAELLRVRFDVFVGVIEAPDYLHALLKKLRSRFRLGLLSNYPDGKAIRESLERLNLTRLLDAVVVSGEVGRVKPHEAPFLAVLDKLRVRPDEAIYVGDNWLGDIQGAKDVGMSAAWTRQFQTPEHFDPKPGDHQPDFVIEHLTELEALIA